MGKNRDRYIENQASGKNIYKLQKKKWYKQEIIILINTLGEREVRKYACEQKAVNAQLPWQEGRRQCKELGVETCQHKHIIWNIDITTQRKAAIIESEQRGKGKELLCFIINYMSVWFLLTMYLYYLDFKFFLRN